MSRRAYGGLGKRNFTTLVSLVIAIGLLFAQRAGWFSQAAQTAEVNQPGLYSINHYIDGDTIAVNMNGQVETVRFIGIDTPETHKPNTPVQCYGPAAAAHTQNVIKNAGAHVRLAADRQGTDRDRYGRLLRYVYLPNGTLVNLLNIQQGYAFYYPYFPFTKKAEFKAAQDQAKAAAKGLWGACTPTPSDDGGYKMDEPAASQQT
jgi:micrococcal nuclease